MEAQRLVWLGIFMLTSGVSFLRNVSGHVCIPEEKIDPTTGKLRWSIPRVERCQCQAVMVPRITTFKHYTCAENKEKHNNTALWFFDDIKPLTNRKNWVKKELDILLDRRECYINECNSDPCVNGAVCHDRVGRYICQCRRGFEGINCQTDIEAPTLVCPVNQHVETDPGKPFSRVVYEVTATDNSEKTMQVYCTKGSERYEIGDTNVSCISLDEAKNQGTCQFTIYVKDTEDPKIICPQDKSVTTEWRKAFATVSYNAPYASDNSGQIPTVACTVDSGSQFQIGDTHVTCNARDKAGNNATCGFVVSVTDTENPEITCPGLKSVTTDTKKAFATVSYGSPDASDNSGQILTVQCAKSSGSQFVIGDTRVTCNARDDAGNSALCGFIVRVRDDEDPLISCPGLKSATTDYGSSYATVSYNSPDASDNSGQRPSVQCSKSSGRRDFEMGDTRITCNARDRAGNSASCSFTVRVRDAEDPSITCPSSKVECSWSGSAIEVDFNNPTATDNLGDVDVSCNKRSGQEFSEGTTTVTCTATDDAGNTASCSFTVRIKSRTACLK